MGLSDDQISEALGFQPLNLTMTCPSCQQGGKCQALRIPVPGEVVLCLNCGWPLLVLSVEDGKLSLRLADETDLEQLEPQTAASVRKAAEAIRFVDGLFNDRPVN